MPFVATNISGTNEIQLCKQRWCSTLYVFGAIPKRLVDINGQLLSFTSGDHSTQQIPAPVLEHHSHHPHSTSSIVPGRVSAKVPYWLDHSLIGVGDLYEEGIAKKHRSPQAPIVTPASNNKVLAC